MRFNNVRALSLNRTILLAFAILAMTICGLPVTARAESIPKSFTSRAECKAKVSAAPATDIVKYGQERAANRAKTVASYKKYVETRYGTYDKNLVKAQAAYKKKVGSDPPANLASLAKNHKAELLKELDSAQSAIDKAKADINSPTLALMQTQLADEVCGLLYDVRVYSYFNEKIKAQYAVDGLYNLNAVNNYQRESVVKLYEKNASKDGVKALKADIDKLPKPSDRVGKIDALQSKVGPITAAAYNAQPMAQPFKDIFGEVSTVKKSLSDDRAKISAVSGKLTAATKKKPKAAKKSSSSTDTSSGSASSGDTSSAKKVAKKTTAKKPSKCNKGTERDPNRGGGSRCVIICNKDEVPAGNHGALCACPSGKKRPSPGSRQCISTSSCKPGETKTLSGCVSSKLIGN